MTDPVEVLRGVIIDWTRDIAEWTIAPRDAEDALAAVVRLRDAAEDVLSRTTDESISDRWLRLEEAFAPFAQEER